MWCWAASCDPPLPHPPPLNNRPVIVGNSAEKTRQSVVDPPHTVAIDPPHTVAVDPPHTVAIDPPLTGAKDPPLPEL